jgi:hypothetical protein
MVHEEVAHLTRYSGKKVSAVLPLDVSAAEESQVHLVGQAGGSGRVTVSFLPQETGGDAS